MGFDGKRIILMVLVDKNYIIEISLCISHHFIVISSIAFGMRLLIHILLLLCHLIGCWLVERTSRDIGPVKININIKETNLVYVKIHKCSSTTTSGVARRIAHFNNISDWDKDLSKPITNQKGQQQMMFINASHEPGVFANHKERSTLQPYIDRLRLPVFIFTTVREPASLAISYFYYFDRYKPWTEDQLMIFLKNRRNPLFDYMKVHNNDSVEQVLSAYDFIGATEYYNYSSVLLSHALQIPVRQVLHVDGKIRGASDGKGIKNYSQAVVHYLKEEFPKHNKLDYEIYYKVTNALKRQMESVTDSVVRNELAERLTLYNDLETKVKNNCQAAYKLKDCYWNDNGCGRACMDSLSSTLG